MASPLEHILRCLPAAVHATDAAGRITFCNDAATRLWGLRPDMGGSEVRDRLKLSGPDGAALRRDPMEIALDDRTAVDGQEVVAEVPDGGRAPFLAYATPLFAAGGALIGAVSMLVDISGRKPAELVSQRLASIVECSDDAILSKDINGVIMSWNRGAEHLFGYAEHEVIGQPGTMLIPSDRQNEEPEILGRIRRGERIEHYETIRQRKDGSFVDISLSVSPIRDASGAVVGASKIARDISDQRRAEEQKDLLLREMNHRVKNLFALAAGLVNLSARGATSIPDLVSDIQGKFLALSRAHSLTLAPVDGGAARVATLHALIDEITEPYNDDQTGEPRITVTGVDTPLGHQAVTNISLLLHEFATNALKYGALADPLGQVRIDCLDQGENLCIVWREITARPIAEAPAGEGFGSRLARATISALNGGFSREFTATGLEIRLTLAQAKLGA